MKFIEDLYEDIDALQKGTNDAAQSSEDAIHNAIVIAVISLIAFLIVVYVFLNYKDNLLQQLNDSEGKEIIFRKFEKMYNKLFSEEVIKEHSFDEIKNDIPNVVKKRHVILKNSDGAATQGLDRIKKHSIYVGGYPYLL